MNTVKKAGLIGSLVFFTFLYTIGHAFISPLLCDCDDNIKQKKIPFTLSSLKNVFFDKLKDGNLWGLLLVLMLSQLALSGLYCR